MSQRKVCVVVNSRANYGRIKSFLRAASEHPGLKLQLVVGASALLHRFGKAIDIIRGDGFEPQAVVHSIVDGETPTTMAKSVGLGTIELATHFEALKPDVVLTVADRFETIATAIAASYMNIPVAHTQGGEVTGSIDEKVRHAVTKLSNLHLVSTKGAAERVKRLGEVPETVVVTGCPSIDIAAEVAARPELDFDPFAKYGGVGPNKFDLSKGYLVVMQHPVTTEYEEARRQVEETLYAVKTIGMPVLWFWPNVDAGSDGTSKGIRVFREREKPDNLHLFRNMYPEDFLRLLVHSTAIVGNSSVAIRECSFLGVPAVNVGTRQQGRERGANVIDVEHDRAAIAAAIREHARRGRPKADHLYGDGDAGQRIADCLATAPLTIEKRLTY